MADQFADGVASGTLEKALAYLREHPDSSARTVAKGIGSNDQHHVFNVLDQAAYKGLCQRWQKNRSSAWLWQACEQSGAAE